MRRNRKENNQSCRQCRHFQNSPELLEDLFKGLTSLSSAHGSVRCEDGICARNDLYLAANRWCEEFEPYPSSQREETTAARGIDPLS